MAFQAKGRTVWQIKVPTQEFAGGRRVTVKRTTDTEAKNIATAIETMVQQLADLHHAWDVLALVTAGDLTLRDLYATWVRVDRKLDPLRTALGASRPLAGAATPEPVVLLKPLVEKWEVTLLSSGRKKKLQPDTADKYAMAVRCFIDGEDTLPLSALTAVALLEHKDSLELEPGTVLKRLNGLNDFCKWLVSRQYLAANPMDSVERPAPADPRDKYLSSAQVIVLADAKTPEYRALDYVMAGTSADLSTALAMVRGDINLKTWEASLRGTKNKNRIRKAVVAKFARDAIRALCEGLEPHERLFPTIPNRWTARDKHATVCAALAKENPVYEGYWLRDHRHTFGVRLAKAGVPLQLIADQMGNTLEMAVRVYAKHVSSGEERQRWERIAAKHDQPAVRRKKASTRDPERDPQHAAL